MKYSKITQFLKIFPIIIIVGLFLLLPQKAKAFSWKQVNESGFGTNNNFVVTWTHVFEGYMYVGTLVNNPMENRAQIYRSANGTDWDAVTTDGFGEMTNFGFVRFETFENRIYVGSDNLAGAQVWSSASGAAGTWTRANPLGFPNGADIDNTSSVLSMAVFGDYLYVGLEDMIDGASIWRTDDGATWTRVSDYGLDGTVESFGVLSLEVFDNQLYAGIENINDPLEGGKIFRSANGAVWTEVVNDGFGNVDNVGVSMLETFKGDLYAGTWNELDGSELWRSSTGNVGSWDRMLSAGFNDTENRVFGFQGVVVENSLDGESFFWFGTRNGTGGSSDGAALLYSADGEIWNQEGENGFGDEHNYGLFATTFNESFYVGFSNATTGIQIWRSEYLSVTPQTLPDGTLGEVYSTTLTDENGTNPVNYSLTGSLPPGLTLSQNGAISGTPTQVGEYTFQIAARDSGLFQQALTRTYAININPILPETGSDTSQNGSSLEGGILCISMILLFPLKEKLFSIKN